jgi:hypothetical protein
MPTLNLLAEVLIVEAALDETIRKCERRQQSLIGKLPIIRTNLQSRQIDLSAKKIQVKAAKQYLNATS